MPLERFPLSTGVLVLCLVLFALLDGFITLVLLEDRFEEANPAMRFLLEYGPTAFVMGKYVLTVVGLPILLIYRQRNMFRTRVRVEHVLPTLVACYVVLLIYQCVLLSRL